MSTKNGGNNGNRGKPSEHRTSRTISASEAARNLNELIELVNFYGEPFIIERNGEPICEIRPASAPTFSGTDFGSLKRSLPEVDEQYLNLIEELVNTPFSFPEPGPDS